MIEITDQMVERAARAIAGDAWAFASVREIAMRDARNALTAALARPAQAAPADRAVEEEPIGDATSLGPCTSICDAASYGDGPRSACWTPWCKCMCHKRASAARYAASADRAVEGSDDV